MNQPSCGAVVLFSGNARDHSEGREDVSRLEYEAYEPLVISEGEKVLAEAREQFPFLDARCVHRVHSAADEAALAVLSAAFDAKPFAVSELPETDWVAHVRRELAPVEAGRFFVYGSHDAEDVPQDRIPLLIEAAMAFGTGHHGTTLGCLQALDKLISEGFEANLSLIQLRQQVTGARINH